MAVTVNLHAMHRNYTNGHDLIEVEGATVGECLASLITQYPDMQKALFDKKGNLLRIVEIFVNQHSAYPEELNKRVKDGDQVSITLMLAGG